MSVGQFKSRLGGLVDQVRALVQEHMLDCGDKESESQKVGMVLRLNELQATINGITSEDMNAEEHFVQEFKIFRVSENTNGFGLCGVWVMNRNGDAFEVAASALTLSSKPKGSVVRLEHREGCINSNGSFSFEIPCSRGKAPAEVVKEVWGE